MRLCMTIRGFTVAGKVRELRPFLRRLTAYGTTLGLVTRSGGAEHEGLTRPRP